MQINIFPTGDSELLQLAEWIAMPETFRAKHAPLFRREFILGAEASLASFIICGLGVHEAFINGQRVGDHVLNPAQTDYDIRVFYVRHDVTRLLQRSTNTLGVMLGDGWFNQDVCWESTVSYGPPRFIAVLSVELADGSSVVVGSDGSWNCARGPIVSANVYAGEHYDARLEPVGWNRNDFDLDKARHAFRWMQAEVVPAPGGGRLEPQIIPPIKRVGTIRPRTITRPHPGCQVVDMGQNFSGWARIGVTAPAGTCIRLRFAEALSENGMVDTGSTGAFATGVEQTDTYVCRGDAKEIWEPRFTYHAFRYVEVVGWPGEITRDDITGVVVHTALETRGFFECSDERLNQLHRMARWTHVSNIHGIPEDCPARERCGWLGDAHLICELSFYNYGGNAFWAKYLEDIETERQRNGGLPTMIAPGRRTAGTASPDWMAALILIPWNHYVFYGELDILKRHWEGMRAVIAHFEKLSRDGLLSEGLGDWFDPGISAYPRYTPPVVTSTLLFGQCAFIMSEVATLLGHDQEAEHQACLSRSIRAAFHRHFYNRTEHTFGSQTADAMALQLGFVPDGDSQAIADSLARNVVDTCSQHFTTGIMGIRYLFEALTCHGYGNVALALMRQNSYPSFGDLIQRGATTLWECWGEREVEAVHGPRSLNHPMFAGYDNWFFNTLAGIRPDPCHPGFKRFYLKPHPISGLNWINAWHDCPHGRIVSCWTNDPGKFSWKVSVPAGTTVLALLPGTEKYTELNAGDYHFN
jgi:alpha-L-rhamnosidase